MNHKQRTSGCLGKFLWAVGILTLAILLLLAGLVANQNIALARDRTQSPAPGRLVEVAGHRLHIHCSGDGAPIVVIDAGNGSFSVEWTPIQQSLRQTTRVCTYDRAGYGWSEPGPQPRDGGKVVTELHELLQAVGEPGPYLLVGHSLGGAHVRLFAARYPQETAGLVLVDAPYPLTITPEFERQMQASIGFYQVMKGLSGSGVLRILGPLGGANSMPATARKLPPELQPTYLNLLLDPNQYATAIAEMQSLPQTFEETSQFLTGQQPLGDLPLIVLTAGQTAAPGSTPFDETYIPVPAEQLQRQAELAGQSSRGEQRVIAESTHSVHLDAPEAVMRAVQDMIQIHR